MSGNPYAPPGPPQRTGGGWPSWLIAVTGIVGGLVLLVIPVAGLVIATSRPDRTSAGPAAPGPSATSPASPTSPSSPASPTGPSPDPGVGTGREQLDIAFPDGAVGSFAVPVGMQHSGDDSEGHVSMWSVEPFGAPYLDVYTDDSAAARRSDLHGAATAERAYAADRGGRASTITYRTAGGHPVAQFMVRTHGTYADQVYDNLVTVLVVRRQVVVIYFSDHPGRYVSARAHRDSAAVVQSFRAAAAGGTTT